MTIPYIAQVYSVPDEILWESLGLPPMEPDEARRTSLFRLNQQLFPGQQRRRSSRVKQAILDFQAHQPPPPGESTQPASGTTSAVTASLTEYLLAYILNYGAAFLGLVLLLGAIGIPTPDHAAGDCRRRLRPPGFARPSHGGCHLPGRRADRRLALLWLGRYAGGWVERRYGATSAWQSARQSFLKYGAWSIYLSRFLLVSIAIPINLVAGSTSFGYRRFFPLILVGEITWLVGFGCLGYAFGSQWEAISAFASDFGGLLLGLVILAAGIYLAISSAASEAHPYRCHPRKPGLS